MKIQVVAVGNKIPDWAKKSINQYFKRLTWKLEFSCHEIKKKQDNISELETKLLLSKVKYSYVIALERRGQKLDSYGIANKMKSYQINGKNISILIGGSKGLVLDLLQKEVNEYWSFSSLTFTHVFARIILIEQLYRAQCINAKHPYHK